jgi:hypothetical protein
MDTTVATVISASIGGGVGLATAFLTARWRVQELKKGLSLEQGVQKEREDDKKRIQYLDPLLVAATDLRGKISELHDQLSTREDFWKRSFDQVKAFDRNKRSEFAYWCNGEGAGPITTLYVTCVYFARATRIRSELPFIQMGPHDDKSLLHHLTEVRNAFGGEHNLWIEIQDSLGEYLSDSNGRVMNYRSFCNQLADPWDHIWFIRLIDFYRDVHLKRTHELPRIQTALKELISFLKSASKPQEVRP